MTTEHLIFILNSDDRAVYSENEIIQCWHVVDREFVYNREEDLWIFAYDIDDFFSPCEAETAHSYYLPIE